ncbi:hypothetical protein FRC02_010673 [Tulasnella sp. 418]|nr:hypothetical protein FRC02_010673 [Tulasnella sp. 418]
MAQADDVPRFRGEESAEEAERWLEIFIANTGSFSDSGILRLVQRKFPVGSPSRMWFDSLDEAVTTSWKVFEPRFCDRWVASHELEEWKRFKQHQLTEDMIFKEDSNHEITQQVISVWADDHLVWGKSVDFADQVLIDATKRLLPPFIQAYLEAFIGVDSQRFEDLCQALKSIPLQVINLERIRRHISSEDWRANMEKRIVDISAKVDRLIMNTCQQNSRHVHHVSSSLDRETIPESHLHSDNTSPTDKFRWEPCSPLTSIPRNEPSDISEEISTPTPEQINLSPSPTGVEQIPLSESDSLYRIPIEWRKPFCSKSRDELIKITQQAIDFSLNYGQNLTVKVCQRRIFRSTISIRDRLIQGNLHQDEYPLKESGNEVLYDGLLAGN